MSDGNGYAKLGRIFQILLVFAADALNIWAISGVGGHVNNTRTAYKVNFSGMATEFWKKW